MHIAWLASLPVRAGRPLDLVVHGDSTIARELAVHFRKVSWIDTSSFVKAVHRQKATRLGNGKLVWERSPTLNGAPIDDLVDHNIGETTSHYSIHCSAA